MLLEKENSETDRLFSKDTDLLLQTGQNPAWAEMIQSSSENADEFVHTIAGSEQLSF